MAANKARSKLTKELAIAPGGFIQQTSIEDQLTSKGWDTDRSVMFNVQLFDAALFSNLGLPIPPTPVTAKTNSDHGYPFFRIYEDTSDISGSFAVDSVGTLDKRTGINVEDHEVEQALSFHDAIIDGKRWADVKSTPVAHNTKDSISVFLPIRLRQKANR